MVADLRKDLSLDEKKRAYCPGDHIWKVLQNAGKRLTRLPAKEISDLEGLFRGIQDWKSGKRDLKGFATSTLITRGEGAVFTLLMTIIRQSVMTAINSAVGVQFWPIFISAGVVIGAIAKVVVPQMFAKFLEVTTGVSKGSYVVLADEVTSSGHAVELSKSIPKEKRGDLKTTITGRNDVDCTKAWNNLNKGLYVVKEIIQSTTTTTTTTTTKKPESAKDDDNDDNGSWWSRKKSKSSWWSSSSSSSASSFIVSKLTNLITKRDDPDLSLRDEYFADKGDAIRVAKSTGNDAEDNNNNDSNDEKKEKGGWFSSFKAPKFELPTWNKENNEDDDKYPQECFKVSPFHMPTRGQNNAAGDFFSRLPMATIHKTEEMFKNLFKSIGNELHFREDTTTRGLTKVITDTVESQLKFSTVLEGMVSYWGII